MIGAFKVEVDDRRIEDERDLGQKRNQGLRQINQGRWDKLGIHSKIK